MSDAPAGLPKYVPSRKWSPARTFLAMLLLVPLAAGGGWLYQSALDGVSKGGARFGIGLVALIGLCLAAWAFVTFIHCRNDDVAFRAMGVVAGAFWFASWGAALVAAQADLGLPPDDPQSWIDAFSERWRLRSVPLLSWPFEALVLVLLPMGVAANEADDPYCEDVGAWAKPRRLGIARNVDEGALKAAVESGDLTAVFSAAARGGGARRARFELLTAPKSRHQWLKVTLLEDPKKGSPTDDDSGTDLATAAVVTTEERVALEQAFGPA